MSQAASATYGKAKNSQCLATQSFKDSEVTRLIHHMEERVHKEALFIILPPVHMVVVPTQAQVPTSQS